MRTLPKPTTVIDIGKVKEDFTKGGRKIMIGINVVRNDFTGKQQGWVCCNTSKQLFSR